MRKLPANISKRVLTADEAAEFCGCNTKRQFFNRVRRGLYPNAIDGKRENGWDLKALERRLDVLSGLALTSDEEDEKRWLEALNG